MQRLRHLRIKHSLTTYRHSKAFKGYETFSEKVGVFRRNLYKFGDIFGESSETFGDSSSHLSSNKNGFCATQDELGALRPATIAEHRNPKPNTLGCAGRYLLHIRTCDEGASSIPAIFSRQSIRRVPSWQLRKLRELDEVLRP